MTLSQTYPRHQKTTDHFMQLSTIETVSGLFSKLKVNPGADSSALCEQIIVLFPLLFKEDQKNFSRAFFKWAVKYKTRYPVIYCYGRYIKMADDFFSELHENVLSEGPDLQKSFLAINEPAGAAIVETFLGSMYRTLGNIDLALKSLWDAYGQLNKLSRFAHYKMACSFHIGSIYMELNNYEEALPILNETLSLAKRSEDNLWIIYTSHGLGKLYLQQKNYQNARLMFEEAMEVADSTRVPLLTSTAYTQLGNYYYETGDYTQSEELHTKAAEIRMDNKFFGGAITNFIRLGEINIKLSELDEAIAVLNKGLQLAEQIKVKPKIYPIHLLLSEIYQCKKNPVRSLFHHRQFHQVEEEVRQAETTRKISNVKMVFEAEQTRKENIIIKKQKAEIQKKNIELQETIDELTITKASRKAKAITLFIAIGFFIFEDTILGFVTSLLRLMAADNFYFSMAIKIAIIFSLNPINRAIERYLLRKVIRKNKKECEDEEYTDHLLSEGLNFAG